MNLTAERLRSVLYYDPATGIFTWRVSLRGPIKAGMRASSVTNCGYIAVVIDGSRYLAHRLAWLYVFGSWPELHLDHANGNRLDNRIENLRLATMSQNLANARRPRTNTSGFKGVSWVNSRGKWEAYIQVMGRKRHLGYWDDPEKAKSARDHAAGVAWGEFARSA